jgi:hypothetical protein
MNAEESRKIIEDYSKNLPKPTAYYYHDPYDDGKYCGSGWRYEYPPVSGALIDAILERDKNCKQYDPEKDSTEIKDEKFCDELAERFTSLMKRANKSENTAVDEYRKKNSHLYSMVTGYNHNKITIIPMSLSTLCDFKEKCEKAAGEIGLKNFYIYEHKDDKDINGKMVYGSAPYGGFFIDSSSEHAFSDALRYCDCFKRYAKESSNYELISSLCDNITECVESLCKAVELDYMQRINNYIAKEQK